MHYHSVMRLVMLSIVPWYVIEYQRSRTAGLLWRCTLGDFGRETEGDFKNHVHIHRGSVPSCRFEFPGWGGVSHRLRKRRTSVAEHGDSVDLAVSSDHRRNLYAEFRPG